MERAVESNAVDEAARMFGGVPISIEVELGRRVMSISEIISLNEGSVLQLDRSAGENIDLWIGGVLVAFGEIVILEESTGVRITDFVV